VEHSDFKLHEEDPDDEGYIICTYFCHKANKIVRDVVHPEFLRDNNTTMLMVCEGCAGTNGGNALKLPISKYELAFVRLALA
jgi:hypothetical protein